MEGEKRAELKVQSYYYTFNTFYTLDAGGSLSLFQVL